MQKITIKNLSKVTALLFLLSTTITAVSAQQNPYTIQIQGTEFNLEENIQTFTWDDLEENQRIGNGYYTWVQFYETPTQQIQDSFKNQGIEILEFIGSKTYLTYIPNTITTIYLQSSGVRAIDTVSGSSKLSEDLRLGIIGDWAQQGDEILVTLQYHKRVTSDFVIQDLASKQISVAQLYQGSNNIDLVIPSNCLEDLSSLAYVKYVEVIAPPAVKEDTPARSLHRASGLDTQTGAGRNYTGAGIGVLVRDDGIVGPHIDFQGRIDNSLTSGSGQTHGDGVSGILAGAGNLNPNNRGMAAGSDLHVVSYVPNFLDNATTSLINDGSVQITNSSYGDGCNGGYTTIARTVDQQTKDTPSLLHVFSTGNSGGTNCGYGAGNAWGTITGGHKQGKNVIATANVFFDGSLAGSSSRGPATDGRIKPDITANGQNQRSTDENNGYLTFGGTSGASPGIAGIAAQLYEVYGNSNGGELPQSALIKATLLNTANDAGNVGPDFRYGWGIVNGLRAGMLIEDERFLSDNATQGSTNSHTINVPDGTTQVRFMLYWSDEPATPGANTALVNDLDLVVNTPSSEELLPWILDPTPNAANLNTPATTGADHLNNMEQVLINNPAAGNYTIDVSGFNVPIGPQEYFIVYEIIENELTVTYPNDGESLVPGTNEVIHWDAVNTTESFAVEYSVDGGNSYTSIATVPANQDFFIWNVPVDISGQAKVRVTSGSFTDESDGTFAIAEQVTGITLDAACPTELLLSWNPVDNANSYSVYLLGDQFMELAATSDTNSISVPIDTVLAEYWYAVTASNTDEGWTSERTIAQFFEGGLFNCVLDDDLSVTDILSEGGDFSAACGDVDGIVTAAITNNGTVEAADFMMSYQLAGQDSVEEPYTGAPIAVGETVEFSFVTPLTTDQSGFFDLDVVVLLNGDEFVDNDVFTKELFIQADAVATPVTEDFQSGSFPPESWTVVNEGDDNVTWAEITNIIGLDGLSTVSWMNNFNYNGQGALDILETPIYDLNLANATLSFDIAKAQFSDTRSDGLRVEISADCGETYTTLLEQSGTELSTLPDFVTFNWGPSNSSQWRTEQIDISSFVGQSVIIRFVNISGNGNNTFIDNIRVEDLLSVSDNILEDISIFPNPADAQLNISLPNTLLGDVNLRITNSLGQVVMTENEVATGSPMTMDVSRLSQGMYFLTIQNGNSSTVEKLIIQ